MKKLTIDSVTCESTTNISNGNDVFLMVQVDGGPPFRYPVSDTITMNSGDRQQFPVSGDGPKPTFFFDDLVSISIWDHDGRANFLDQADFLGCGTIRKQDSSYPYVFWGVDSSEYSLQLDITTVDTAPLADGGNALPSNVQEAAKTALNDFIASDDGKSALHKSKPEELSGIFSKALQSDAFQDLVGLIGDIPAVKAVSLGLLGQVEIFVGINGGFGVAADIDNFPHEWATYAGAGVLEGVDLGAEAVFAIGFWFESTDEIGGFYVGAELDLDEGVGVTGLAWAGRSDKDDFISEEGEIDLQHAKVAFVGLDIGLDDGVEADELYCFSGHIEKYPCFQTGSFDHAAYIWDIQCNNQSSDAGCDRVYFHWWVDGDDSQKYRWPVWNHVEMDAGQKAYLYPGAVVKFNQSFHIDVYVQNSGLDKPSLVESQKYELDDFEPDPSQANKLRLKHTMDNSAFFFQAVKYTVIAELLDNPT